MFGFERETSNLLSLTFSGSKSGVTCYNAHTDEPQLVQPHLYKELYTVRLAMAYSFLPLTINMWTERINVATCEHVCVRQRVCEGLCAYIVCVSGSFWKWRSYHFACEELELEVPNPVVFSQHVVSLYQATCGISGNDRAVSQK